jgi:hypothetical protein
LLWQEGDKLCQALQQELEAVPSAQMPCSKTSYLIGPIDWAVAAQTGGATQRSSTRYQFDDDGELYQVDTDRGDDGTNEVTYRCSAIGKILMPVTNYAAWSSYSTFEELAQGSAQMAERVPERDVTVVPGLRTRLRILGDPALSSFLILKASTRDEDNRLQRRVVQGMTQGRLTVSDFEYDRQGNLRSRRQMSIYHPYTLSRQTDYTYQCWD